MAQMHRGGPPLVKGQFGVFVDGFTLGYWTKAKIPSMKVKKTSVQEAGAPVAKHYPSGLAEFDDLELSSYMGTDGALTDDLEAWLKACVDPRTGRTTLDPESARKDITVVQYDTDGTEIEEWRCHGGFPIDLGAIELEAGDEKKVYRDSKFSVDWVEKVR